MVKVWGSSRGKRDDPRARLVSLLELVQSETPELKLAKLIFHVAASSQKKITDLLAAPEGRGLGATTSAALLSGEVDDVLTDEVFANVLRAWGADTTTVGLASELLAQIRAHPAERPDDPPPAEAAEAAPPEPEPRPDDQPDPGKAETAADLIRTLRAHRIWKGKPSFRVMAERIGNRYAVSTLSTAVQGTKLPTLAVYLAFLEGCETPRDELDTWKNAWQKIAVREAHGRDAP